MGLASEVGVKLASYSEDWYGNEVDVVEMDGAVDKLEEIIYPESQMCNTGTEFYGELTEQIVKNKDAPGSDNGTGLMQTLCSFKIREAHELCAATRGVPVMDLSAPAWHAVYARTTR